MKSGSLAFCLAIMLLMTGVASATGERVAVSMNLEECLKTAKERNSAVNIAIRQRKKAEIFKEEAFGKALPDLDISANYTREGKNPEVEFFDTKFKLAPDSSYNINATLSQYLYSGAVSSGYTASKLLLLAAGGAEEAARQGLVAQVKTGFYTVIFTKEVIKTEEEAVAQLESHIQDTKDRVAVGLSTKYDIMRLETRLAAERHRLIEAQNIHARAKLDLLNLLGLDPVSQVNLAGALDDYMKPLEVSFTEALASAMDSRPDIKAARARLEATGYIAKAAKSEQYPTVKLFGRYNAANNVGIGDTDKLFDRWNVGVSVDMNIFDGRERSSRMRQRLLDVEIDRVRLEELERQVKVEVKSSFDELARAMEFFKSQRKSIDYAKETYRIAKVNHQEGVMTQLELLDAQFAMTQASINYKKSLFEYATARARLVWAMGGKED